MAQAVVVVADGVMATSVDDRSFTEAGEIRLTHIVDPRSGRPVGHSLASVSVVHREAVRAEAEGIAAYFLVRSEAGSFEARSTRAFPSLHD